MAKKTPPIRYTSRDFASIKDDLVNYAKVYYPETYKDFNEASFGSLLFDMVAHVGDVLSFYVDYQANESFLDSAIETQNILRLAKQMGFKYPGSASSTCICTFYVTVPAASGTAAPDEDLIPILHAGSTLTARNGASFVLSEDIDFSRDDVQIKCAEVDTNGQPISYVFKAYGEVFSGALETEFVEIGAYQKFMKVALDTEKVSEIISVIDSEGHEYHEVDYLSQNVIFKAIRNRKNSDKENAPYVLREMHSPRRFVVEHTIAGETILQFGYGSETTLQEEKFPDPATAALKQYAKNYYKDESFDPNIMLSTEKFGVVPPDGTLTVICRRQTAEDVNLPIGSINGISSPVLSYTVSNVSSANQSSIRDSISVYNDEPVTGQIAAMTPEEIRMRAIDAYASQNRAVTKQDYLSMIYRMPGKFGAIKRANILQDKDSFKRNLNLYVVSEDSSRNLSLASSTLKKNLKIWLNQHRMINDTIDVLDGRIVNFGIEFELVGVLDKEPSEILSVSIEALKEEYKEKFFFGVPFYISDVYRILNDLPEVIDVKTVNIVRRTGTSYSSVNYDIEKNITGDGRFIMVPEDMILELRFPDQDIVGVIV